MVDSDIVGGHYRRGVAVDVLDGDQRDIGVISDPSECPAERVPRRIERKTRDPANGR